MAEGRVLIDTNVVLDLVERSSTWLDWSLEQVERLTLAHRLVINAVIYAELSVGFREIAELERVLDTARLTVEPIPREALFLAGKAFRRYRNAKGTKTGVLPDFFIGAHAAAAGLPLLTRDVRRYRSYFPKLTLITP